MDKLMKQISPHVHVYKSGGFLKTFYDDLGLLIKESKDGKELWFSGMTLKQGTEIVKWINENNVDLKTEEGRMAFKLRWL